MAQKTFTSEMLTSSDVNTYLMGEGGAWTSWTPAVVQSGSVTATNTRSRYARYGRTIHFTARLAITGSGTGGNVVTVSLPVTAAAAGEYCGQGAIYDLSITSRINCFLLFESTTTLSFWDPQSYGNSGYTTALANGDTIDISGTYEAAS